MFKYWTSRSVKHTTEQHNPSLRRQPTTQSRTSENNSRNNPPSGSSGNQNTGNLAMEENTGLRLIGGSIFKGELPRKIDKIHEENKNIIVF